MKSNTLRKRCTDVPTRKESAQAGKDLREADKQRQHKEFIAAMNEFIAKKVLSQMMNFSGYYDA